ncbi:hypothetical protein AAX05_04200 [Moraxella bovoculi]|uniref:CTP synthetase n=1 Tax=Moraxella bovoculi TaxID=386891 RepID=A0AAC8PWY4_9GAMM|nr:hypothetical protein [Moraxella bovoculi]AKG07962.1 hypothetical protein AAX06_07105 [Moraxella bovoculi]AKG09502.1 hypothetical protein AAX05_04200 [Moraxella bovoculi]AKG11317.1 hypothetical protein AAX07_04175 [Moraxella bovoculi]AKG13325.1 hypothetical protein AAX11_03945 [Moraxella bovoculi]
MNIPLFTAMLSIASTVAIGVLMIVAFVTGYDSSKFIIGSVIVGILISLPIALAVTKKISALTGGPNRTP